MIVNIISIYFFQFFSLDGDFWRVRGVRRDLVGPLQSVCRLARRDADTKAGDRGQVLHGRILKTRIRMHCW